LSHDVEIAKTVFWDDEAAKRTEHRGRPCSVCNLFSFIITSVMSCFLLADVLLAGYGSCFQSVGTMKRKNEQRTNASLEVNRSCLSSTFLVLFYSNLRHMLFLFPDALLAGCIGCWTLHREFASRHAALATSIC
jgi:hypothetical protein